MNFDHVIVRLSIKRSCHAHALFKKYSRMYYYIREKKDYCFRNILLFIFLFFWNCGLRILFDPDLCVLYNVSMELRVLFKRKGKMNLFIIN